MQARNCHSKGSAAAAAADFSVPQRMKSHSYHHEENDDDDVLLPSNKKSSSVHFAAQPVTSIHYTLSRKCYAPQERLAVWYSKEDHRNISKDCQKQVCKLNQGKLLKDQKYCARGLESKTFMGNLAYQKNKQLGIQTVLQEQLRSKKEENLAQVYHQVSSSCQMWACAVGLRDQRMAEEYQE